MVNKASQKLIAILMYSLLAIFPIASQWSNFTQLHHDLYDYLAQAALVAYLIFLVYELRRVWLSIEADNLAP